MADRKVTKSGKDKDGDIIRLCNPGSTWGSVTKARAIQQIEDKEHSYYVQQPGTSPVNVNVVNGPSGKYLRTTADPASANNLDNLPDC